MRHAAVPAFLALYAGLTLLWHLPYAVGAVYLGVSTLCFIAYALDKRAAKAGRWRTSESALLWLGLACGWPGALLAQQWLRHKSQKASFRSHFKLTVLLNVIALVYFASPYSLASVEAILHAPRP
ncbi:MAG: DUF1294 domain-containing protein [Pseudomonadota bacterium]